jgi:hypothetical protein
MRDQNAIDTVDTDLQSGELLVQGLSGFIGL